MARPVRSRATSPRTHEHPKDTTHHHNLHLHDNNTTNATAKEWARVKRPWVAQYIDLLRGFLAHDYLDYSLRNASAILVLYAIYLGYCEACTGEAQRVLVVDIARAVADFALLSRGSPSAAALALLLLFYIITVRLIRMPPAVYLLDFTTYRHKVAGGTGDKGHPATHKRFMDESRLARHPDGSVCFTADSIAFQEKIIATSSISDSSVFPHSILPRKLGEYGAKAETCALNMENARLEAAEMMLSTVSDLLEKTGVAPDRIGIVIVNCSLFCPTPSLSAMLVNHFKMRADVLTYNLGGMGCSASPIAVDLARRILSGPEQRNTLALVVSTENITQNWYRGNERSMLLSNCLFRCGASAMLLSNRALDRWRARFKLLHVVRTHMGMSDDCYRSVYQEEDAEGHRGVRLSKRIMQIAGDALKRNITTLSPLVLPKGELLWVLLNMVARQVARGKVPLPAAARRALAKTTRRIIVLPGVRWLVGYKPELLDAAAAATDGDGKKEGSDDAFMRALPPVMPDFTRAFEWICVHTGGRAVIDAMEQNLALPPHYLEPSRLSLYKYGNVSSASVWYELQNIAEYGNACGEQRPGGAPPPASGRRPLRRGDRIWMIAFGSGFKCNSAVWKCLRN